MFGPPEYVLGREGERGREKREHIVPIRLIICVCARVRACARVCRRRRFSWGLARIVRNGIPGLWDHDLTGPPACVCVRACVAYMRVRACSHVIDCVRRNRSDRKHAHAHARTRAHTHVHTPTREKQTCARARTRAHTHTYTHTYTHAHTHTRGRADSAPTAGEVQRLLEERSAGERLARARVVVERARDQLQQHRRLKDLLAQRDPAV